MEELFPLPDSVRLAVHQVLVRAVRMRQSKERRKLVLPFHLERQTLRLQQLLQLLDFACVRQQMPQRFHITPAGRCLLPAEITRARVIGVNQVPGFVEPIREDVIVVYQAMDQRFIR